MASPTGTQWEQAVFNKITINGELMAVVERDISEIKDELIVINNRLAGLEKSMEKMESLQGSLRWIGGGIVAIALSLIANFFYSLIT